MILVPKHQAEAAHVRPPVPTPTICPQLPGTVLRIFIPPGAVINLLNLIEVTSPGGICLIVRLPFLGTRGLPRVGGFDFSTLADAVQKAGGTIEAIEE